MRVNWRVLDRDQDSSESRYLLLSDIENVSVYVLQSVNGVLQPLTTWDAADTLPDGVEWTIQLAGGKQYLRVFEVTGPSEAELP